MNYEQSTSLGGAAAGSARLPALGAGFVPPEIPEALEVQHLSKPPRLTRPAPPVNPYATRVAGGKPVVVRAKAPFKFTRVDDPGTGQAARDEEELK